MKTNLPTRTSFGAAVLLALGLAARPAAADPMPLKDYMALRGPMPTEHIAYGAEPLQYVEWFAPAGAGPYPVAVLIHGGCFQNELEGIPQFRGMASALAARGVAVWSVEYRGLDTAGGGYPGTFLDVRSALDLVAAQAPARHLDVRRLAVVGHSAGGILALWLAGRATLPEASVLHEPEPLAIPAVVALGTSGDLRATAGLLEKRCGVDMARLVGSPSAERPDVFADTSPLALTPNGGRVVLVNGDHDTIYPPAESARYAAALRERGGAVDTVVLPGASHFDEVAVTSASWPQVESILLKAIGGRAPPRAASGPD